jgi:hypothetical protein
VSADKWSVGFAAGLWRVRGGNRLTYGTATDDLDATRQTRWQLRAHARSQTRTRRSADRAARAGFSVRR